jgi:hypothetical protein
MLRGNSKHAIGTQEEWAEDEREGSGVGIDDVEHSEG